MGTGNGGGIPAHRFRGMTAEQIKRVLELDEVAGSVAAYPGTITDVAVGYERAGLRFTTEIAYYYAEEAESKGHKGTALEWGKYLASHGDANWLRRFVIRNHLVDVARKRFLHDVTEEEWRAMGQYHLAQSRSDFDDHLTAAIEAFMQAKDAERLRVCYRKAAAIGNEKSLMHAAEELKIPIGKPERVAMARFFIKCHDFDKAQKYATAHKIQGEVARELIDAAIASGSSYTFVARAAKCLGLELTTTQIEALFKRYAAKERILNIDAMVEVAEVLARRVPKRWKKRLPTLYREARNTAIGWHQPQQAERYGKKCGAPLTAEELLVIADRLGDRARDGLDWAVRDRNFALNLAAKRLATQAAAA